MVAQREPHHTTVDEWRELERNSHDVKHEYIDGHVYAMSGSTLAHARIGLNICASIERGLAAAGKDCNVYNSDAAVRLSSQRFTYPDASVSCDERDQPTADKTEVQFPHVIVEVLSDSTEAYDRGRKFNYYQACESMQEYVLIATKYQAVDVYRRVGNIWTYQTYGPGDKFELTSIGVPLVVTELYRNAGMLENEDENRGEV